MRAGTPEAVRSVAPTSSALPTPVKSVGGDSPAVTKKVTTDGMPGLRDPSAAPSSTGRASVPSKERRASSTSSPDLVLDYDVRRLNLQGDLATDTMRSYFRQIEPLAQALHRLRGRQSEIFAAIASIQTDSGAAAKTRPSDALIRLRAAAQRFKMPDAGALDGASIDRLEAVRAETASLSQECAKFQEKLQGVADKYDDAKEEMDEEDSDAVWGAIKSISKAYISACSPPRSSLQGGLHGLDVMPR